MIFCCEFVTFGISINNQENMMVKNSKCIHSVMSSSLQPHGQHPVRLLCPWNSPGKNTGVGFHFLLQGIFLTQGLNPGFLHGRQILFYPSHQESTQIKIYSH